MHELFYLMNGIYSFSLLPLVQIIRLTIAFDVAKSLLFLLL